MRDRKRFSTSARPDGQDVEAVTPEAGPEPGTPEAGPDGGAAEGPSVAAGSDVETSADAGATEEPVVEDGTDEHESVVAAPEQRSGDVLLRDLEELQDRHLRLAAEFENYRKRTRRELGEMRKRSQADLVRGLLEVLDDLNRVAHAASDATVESLIEGVSLVETKMRKTLADAGLQRVEADGQPFDPNLHEALAIHPTDDPEMDDVVASVLLDGYTLDDLLVRPARVQVMKFEPPMPASRETGDADGEDAQE